MSARVIYLLHFHQPYRHARHYLGSTNCLRDRLKEHRSGHGARLMAAVRAAGIDFDLARTWQETRDDERKLKRLPDGQRRGSLARLCPLCGAHCEKRRGGRVS